MIFTIDWKGRDGKAVAPLCYAPSKEWADLHVKAERHDLLP